MKKLIRRYQELISDPGFLRFQHRKITAVYNQLAEGYLKEEGEVDLVTRMADTLTGKSYRGLRIHCEKIHGSKSRISFNFRGKSINKELGDLILISLVSNKKRRIIQKLCIVQNKVLRDGKSHIDLEQLFLLKNFPLFSGSQGLFRGNCDVMFCNTQRCLGAYGFFEDPGEFIHVNAGVLSNTLSGSQSFEKNKIGTSSRDPDLTEVSIHQYASGFPWIDVDDPILAEVIHYWYRRGYPLPFILSVAPLHSSRQTLHDLHDFIKAWTSLQVGEIVYAFDRALDIDADRFANAVLRAIGFSEYIDFDDENIQDELNIDGFMVMVAHLDLASE